MPAGARSGASETTPAGIFALGATQKSTYYPDTSPRFLRPEWLFGWLTEGVGDYYTRPS